MSAVVGTGSAKPALDERTAGLAVRRDVALLELARVLKTSGYRFITVTPATHARVNARAGNEWARDIEDVFGWSRPFDVNVLPPPVFALMQSADVVVPCLQGWRSTVRFSTLGNHLFAHSAYPTTSSHAVFFGPDTYRFVAALDRHLAGRQAPVERAVDIGSGAGPGAIAIATRHRSADVIAVDINPDALRFTTFNAELAGVPNVVARQSDLLSAVSGEFDLVISNPPYLLDRHKRAYRHGGGGQGEGLSRAVVDAACQRLRPGGTLLLYTGSVIVDGVDAFREILAARLDRPDVDWSYEELDPDVFGEELLEPAYARADRIAAVWVVATKRG